MTRQTPRNFVPLDCNYFRDIAIRKAGPMAELLYVRAIAFAKGSRTAGFVSVWDLEEIGSCIRGAKSCAKRLVEVGLWESVDDGWRIRAWDRWNGEFEAISAGGALGNHIRWHVNKGLVEPSCDLCPDSQGESGGDRGAIGGDESDRVLNKPNRTTTSKEVVGDPNPQDHEVREDVDKLCAHLADRVTANGSKPPVINKAWRDAARLLLDRDRRDVVEAHALIDWCQNDDFWKTNILAMPKFRAQYDKLRLNAARSGQHLRVAAADGERKWTKADLDAVLGDELWFLPQPPAGMGADDRWEWEHRLRLEHHTDRVRRAEAKLSGAATGT